MSALTQNIGTQSSHPDDQAPVACDLGQGRPATKAQIGDLGRVLTCAPNFATTHASLTRFYWLRRAVAAALLDDGRGRPRAAELVEAADGYRIRLTPPLPGDVVPWNPYSVPEFPPTALFGEPAKMACPSFDLPAGAIPTGGTCVAANGAQSTVDPKTQQGYARAILPVLQEAGMRREGVDVASSVCQGCYATANNFSQASVAIGMIIRYWWTHDLVARDPQGWVQAMVTAIRAAGRGSSCGWKEEKHSIDPERTLDQGAKALTARFFRIHSSGDFYDRDYAAAWLEVCRQTEQDGILYWAPTRTWVDRKFLDWWRAQRVPENLSLRPSAYHFGDPAPRLGAPFAAGTTSLFGIDSGEKKQVVQKTGRVMNVRVLVAPPPDPALRDWDCATYRVQNEAHTCRAAEAPNGERGESEGGTGCRTCWIHRDLTVNYAAHA